MNNRKILRARFFQQEGGNEPVREWLLGLDQDDRKAVETDLEALRAVKDSEDAADIKAKIETLGQSSMKLGEAVYKAQAEADATGGGDDTGSGDGGSAESGGDDNVVDHKTINSNSNLSPKKTPT